MTMNLVLTNKKSKLPKSAEVIEKPSQTVSIRTNSTMRKACATTAILTREETNLPLFVITRRGKTMPRGTVDHATRHT